MNTELLIPGPATASDAVARAAIVSLTTMPAIPAKAEVATADGRLLALPPDTWKSWSTPDGGSGVVSAEILIPGLPPRYRGTVRLLIDGREAVSCTINTLPDRLPGALERPLIVMLGSCFCAAEDSAGTLGRRFATLPDGVRPDFKILCGDQVYLDSPYYRFLVRHSDQSLAHTFLSNYANTWGQTGDLQGFQHLLAGGANHFTSDDHEFWNNAPFPSFSLNTWTDLGRKTWTKAALGLFGAFQWNGSRVQRFGVGELQFFIADTRIDRKDDRTNFLCEGDMKGLEEWIAALTFPGVLVIGQPVFDDRSGWTGRFTDWNLPDFDQYERLCRAVAAAPQPIIMLTGDVHYGRVARARWEGRQDLIEIVSSPMALVTGSGKTKWKTAPSRFPARPVKGLPQATITTEATWSRAADHFITIEMWREGGRLRIRVRTWEREAKADSPSRPVFDDIVQRSV